MGRPQGFDTTATVRLAREAFWRTGYDATSVPALESATGLRRSSLYHAFGSKRRLFDAAVASYLDEIIRPRLAPLVADHVSDGAIVDHLVGLRTALLHPGSIPGEYGCLLINSAGEAIGRERDVATVIATYRDDLEAALAAGVAARIPDLEPDGVRRLALLCSSLVVTALTLTRVDPAQAARHLDTAIDLVSPGAARWPADRASTDPVTQHPGGPARRG